MSNAKRKHFTVTITHEAYCRFVVRTNGAIHSICGDEHTARQDAGRQYAANMPIRTRKAVKS